MSFYGKVINQFKGILSKFTADTTTVDATTEDTLQFVGDDTLKPSINYDNKTIQITYAHKEYNAPNFDSITGIDSDGNLYFGLQVPILDKYGHATGTLKNTPILQIIDNNGNIEFKYPDEDNLEGDTILWIGQNYYI